MWLFVIVVVLLEIGSNRHPQWFIGIYANTRVKWLNKNSEIGRTTRKKKTRNVLMCIWCHQNKGKYSKNEWLDCTCEAYIHDRRWKSQINIQQTCVKQFKENQSVNFHRFNLNFIDLVGFDFQLITDDRMIRSNEQATTKNTSTKQANLELQNHTHPNPYQYPCTGIYKNIQNLDEFWCGVCVCVCMTTYTRRFFFRHICSSLFFS